DGQPQPAPGAAHQGPRQPSPQRGDPGPPEASRAADLSGASAGPRLPGPTRPVPRGWPDPSPRGSLTPSGRCLGWQGIFPRAGQAEAVAGLPEAFPQVLLDALAPAA